MSHRPEMRAQMPDDEEWHAFIYDLDNQPLTTHCGQVLPQRPGAGLRYASAEVIPRPTCDDCKEN